MSTPPLIFLLLLALAGLTWIFVPILTGIPWVPTLARRTQRALELASLQPGEIFYDLGCGDGRVLISAARRGARAIGIEVSPLHCLIALIRAALAGVGGRVAVRWGNFYRCDLSDADVIYWYGHSRYGEKLKSYLERQLRVGARVVSINVDFPGWQPEALDRENLIFLYRIPPPVGDINSYLMQKAMD
ncbi:MAG: class I SAM-dependent methyltransferase [Anaerolineales bacterium]|nr:class I SAM-dependent methyltransferase [Anaerolineales bacterium]